MIFSSTKTAYDKLQERYTVPMFSLDTDNYTVTYADEQTGKVRKAPFHSEWVRYHINYIEEFYPERLERLVESGEILNYLEDLDNRVYEAIEEQTDEWKRTERDYLLAVKNGDILAQSKIANTLDERARELIYPKMVLV